MKSEPIRMGGAVSCTLLTWLVSAWGIQLTARAGEAPPVKTRMSAALRQITAGRKAPLKRRSRANGSNAGAPRLLQVVGRFAYSPPGYFGSQFSGVDTIYVEVRDDDTIGHSVIWSGFTDTDGRFDTGVVDISADDNAPDLYVYFETDSPILTVEDGTILRTNYSWSSFDTLLVNDFQGTFYDFGTQMPADTGVGSNIPALNFFQIITRAHRFILQATNINISKVKVVWWTGTVGTYDYDGEISLAEFTTIPRDILHQYAHHLERNVGMAVSATNACSNDCQYCRAPGGACSGSLNSCPWCPVTPSVARSEAFAEWFSKAVGRYFKSQYQFDSGKPFQLPTLDSLSPAFPEDFPPETIPDDPFDDLLDLSEVRAVCGADVLDNADRVPNAIYAFLEDLADLHMDDHAGDGLNDCAFFTDGTVLTTYLIDKPADVLALIDQLILDFPADLPALYSAALNMSPVYTARFPVDIDPPGAVSGVTSPSHPAGLGGPLPCITLEWQLPTDDVTGACAYSYEWTTDPAGLAPDMVEDITANCTLTDGPFDLGQYYISLRAKDCADHWSTDWATFGPFEVNECNGNGIVDVCEINCTPSSQDVGCSVGTLCTSQSSCGQGQDCNNNHVPDDCDVASGDSEDCDENGKPDECQLMHHWAGGSGSWHVDSNWEEGTVPGTDVRVCIDNPQPDSTVTYSMDVLQIGNISCHENLVISGSSLPWIDLTTRSRSFVRGDLTFGGHQNNALHLQSFLIVDGLLTLDDGTIDHGAVSDLVQIEANGGLQVDRSTNVNGIFLDQDNASTSVATSLIALGSGTVFELRSGSSYDFQGNGTVFSGTTGTFHDAGQFTRSTGVGDAKIDVFTKNDGVIQVKTGTLVLSRQSTSSGQFIGDPGTHLEFRGGGHEFLPGSSIVADIVDFRNGISGTNRVRGTYNVTSATTQDGGKAVTFSNEATIISYGQILDIPRGTLNFEAVVGAPINFNSISIGTPISAAGTANFASGDPVSTNTLTIGPGTVKGISSVTVNGVLTWRQGGLFTGPSILNANGGIVVEAGGSAKSLNSTRILNNTAVATFQGGIVMSSSAVFNNLAAGVVDIVFDGTVISNQGGHAFNNSGLLLKEATAGVSSINVPAFNTGTVDVRNGELDFADTFVQTAGETILNGGNLRMSKFPTPPPFQLAGGSVLGTGLIIADVNNTGGRFVPGLPTGVMDVVGTYTQGPAGTLEVEIGGLIQDVDYDLLAVSGDATLAGTLKVAAINAFEPTIGATFQILTAANVIGTFDNLVLLNFPPNLSLKVIYTSSAVTLETVGPPGDLTGDGNVNLNDFGLLNSCMNGPNVNAPPIGCDPIDFANADLDGDNDVDAHDYALLAAYFMG